MVRPSPTCGCRLIDGLVIKGGEHRIAKQSEVDIAGKDVVLIQTKASRLGMYIMGQAFFSDELVKAFGPRSVESICLVAKDDSVLRPIFESHPGMKVVVHSPTVSNTDNSE